MERDAIRAHLVARGIDPGRDIRAAFLPSRLKLRLERDYHRRKPPIGVRRRAGSSVTVTAFTAEQLAHIAERFAGANDPLGQSIARTAANLFNKINGLAAPDAQGRDKSRQGGSDAQGEGKGNPARSMTGEE